MSGPAKDDDVVELLTWDAADGTEEDEEDELEEELAADEEFEPDADEEEESEGALALEEVVADGYAKNGPASIPQPGRAKSHPDLPRVKSTSFKRFIS